MLKKTLLVLALAAACLAAHAQSTPAKKELVARILKLQQPGIESMARGMVEQSAQQLLARAAPAVQARIAPDKQEATAKSIEADARKFVDDTTPIVRERALKLAPATVGALLEEKFSEDDLKQVLAIMESPVYAKFQSLGGELQNALAEKLVAETRAPVEAKLRALEESIGKRLGVTPPPPAAAAAPAPRASGKK